MDAIERPPVMGYIDPNIPNPHGPHDANIIIYGYDFAPLFKLEDAFSDIAHSYVPNVALSILGVVLFVLAAVVHGTQTLLYRTWYFLPLTFACMMEVIGYIFRALSSRSDPYNIIYFVVAYFFIVVAPVFISASIYLCLTRLILWVQDEGLQLRSRVLSRRLILWTFITADTICTAVQIAGAALIGTRESKHKDPTAANNILLAGLALQSLSFIVFLGILVVFIIAVHNASQQHKMLRRSRPFIGALSVSSMLVFLRTLFRLAETSQGVFGYLSSHEAFFGALEFAPIVLAMGILAIWHPGRQIPVLREKRRNGTLHSITV
jgi:hypothetical protein